MASSEKSASNRWKEQNPERVKEYNRKWREENREKMRNQSRKWREENREKVRAQSRRYRERYPEKSKAYVIEWEKQNPEKRREKSRRRRALQRGSLGWMPPFPEGILFGEQNGLCLYCEVDLVGTGWHVDHRVPLSRGGKHDWHNVCLSCPSCNQSKYVQTDLEFKLRSHFDGRG